MNTHYMLIRFIAPLMLLCLMGTQAIGQHLSFNQRDALRAEVEALVNRYKDALELTSDGVTIDHNKVETLRQQFVETNRPVIVNFLLPEKADGSKRLSPAGFAQFAKQHYSDGLDVSLEVVEIEIDDQMVKGAYRAVVSVKARVHGFYMGRRIHSFNDNQYLYVRANMDEDRVVRIEIDRIVGTKHHENIQADRNVSGFYAGLAGGFGGSMLYNSSISSNSDLGLSAGRNFNPSIELTYMLNRNVGFSMGMRFSQSDSWLYPEDMQQRFEPTKDIDGDTYEPITITSSFEELTTIKTLDIPMLFRFRMGRETGFYADLGIAYSTFRSATFNQGGTIERQGYYPDYQVTLKDIDEYGFTTQTLKDEAYSLETPSSALSAVAGLGVTSRIGEHLMLRVGATMRYGLSDLTTDAWDNPFLFGAAARSNGQGSFLHSIGLDVGLAYRIYTHNP